MGAAVGSPLALAPEAPNHKVCVDAFLLDQTEVTQSEYRKIMGNNPSQHEDCRSCPVENVTWQNAFDYCNKVGKRLPTEAEWEYAARSATKTLYFWGDTLSGDYSWNMFNSDNQSQPVRQRLANAWKLYDMSGNVWEWVNDWYGEQYYAQSPSKNPVGPENGDVKLMRGGAFSGNTANLRPSSRAWATPFSASPYVGFRCAK